MPKKLHLVHGPTPIQTVPELNRLMECEVWLKRDDMTGGPEAGNKIRKLEYLLGDALYHGADCVITCGATQSNHARATALLARRFGLDCHLLLRNDLDSEPAPSGNLLLCRLSGASITFISSADYAARAPKMQELASALRDKGATPYVIPEGGSNGLGALGYVDAMEETRKQAELGLLPRDIDSVAFACGSGGTAAGVALGIARFGVAKRADAFIVCDDKSHFENHIAGIIAEACRRRPELSSPARLDIHDNAQGPGYGYMDDEQLSFLHRVVARTGLVFDPVYTGKALYGLSRLDDKPNRVLFLHTGGLPGLLAQSQLMFPQEPSAGDDVKPIEG